MSTQMNATTNAGELKEAPEATADVADEPVERTVYTFGDDDGQQMLADGFVVVGLPQAQAGDV